MFDIKTSDWVIAAATILGPILAVQAQKWVENWRSQRQGRLSVFYALMATRATRLAPEHVLALNRIDLEFYPRPFWFFPPLNKVALEAVLEAWRLYSQQLNKRYDANDQGQTATWTADVDRYFFDLLHKMSLALNFKFKRSYLQENAYYPTGHGMKDNYQSAILEGAAAVLSGQRPMRMSITEFPSIPEAVENQQKLQVALLKALEDGVLHISADHKVELKKPPKAQ